MPKHEGIEKVLVIGSGPIIIGQAAEFDYAGTQACLALKEEGCNVVLVNNNPATIMTDERVADTVYFEPLTVDSLEHIIAKEQPDGLLATLGGQTGLNLAFDLHQAGILQKYSVTLLGTDIESIMKGEDREAFRALMHELGEPVPDSEIIANVEEALIFAEKISYPLIVRPAYTLGGTGGGFAHNKDELIDYVTSGLEASPIHQCLVEKSIAGLKEIEYEVIRDDNDRCLIICDMENVDPVGVHTGDSIVVAPSQTLTQAESDKLRTVAVKIIRALGIIGGCNIQIALNSNTGDYYLIEVNPRVSRSSALASKATGYPIAKVAAKLSLGYHLDEIIDPDTGIPYASREPQLEYVTVKIPRWPFDKFPDADRTLGTQMKATGEVMAIEYNFEGAVQKAVRSLEIGVNGLEDPDMAEWSKEALWNHVTTPSDRRLFAILELIRRGVSVKDIHDKTDIAGFFLDGFNHLVQMEQQVKKGSFAGINASQLSEFKQAGFSDEWLALAWGVNMLSVREKRNQFGIYPSYQKVDTGASEFETQSAYYYSSWQGKNDVMPSARKKILVIGSGPIRIGQGIEFDYCSVHAVQALQKMGYETIIINNNPETVSTDYTLADRLYFEPLATEDVLNVIEFEKVDGVVVQVGGQTAITLVKGLEEAGIPVLGINQQTMDELEDRDLFYRFMENINVPHIPGLTATNARDLTHKAGEIGFPVLLRPSYVIGGRGMVILTSEEELESYINHSLSEISYPILVDAYVPGKEAEVDVLTDGENVRIPGIFEHVEKAGVHSGDSTAVTPPFSLSTGVKDKISTATKRIARAMNFKGIFNIQFIVDGEKVYVLEINPRASRTVPVLSKVYGIDMIGIATGLMLGGKLVDQTGVLPENNYYTVKHPVFSTTKLPDVDPVLCPEMKSTGEVISISEEDQTVLHNLHVHSGEEVFCEIDSSQWEHFTKISDQLHEAGLVLISDHKRFARCFGLIYVPSFEDWVKSEKASMFLNIEKPGGSTGKDRRILAVHNRLEVITEWTRLAMLTTQEASKKKPRSIGEWLKKQEGSLIH